MISLLSDLCFSGPAVGLNADATRQRGDSNTSRDAVNETDDMECRVREILKSLNREAGDDYLSLGVAGTIITTKGDLIIDHQRQIWVTGRLRKKLTTTQFTRIIKPYATVIT